MDERAMDARADAMMAGVEADGVRLFRLVIALCLLVTLAGTFGFAALLGLIRSNHGVLERLKADQDMKIARLNEQIAVDRSVEDQMVAYIVQLARKAKAAGVDPGELVIHPPAPGAR